MAVFQSFFRSAFRLVSDTRGVTAAVVAMGMATLVGFAGLGVETGLWFSQKRVYQTAADAGALAGAWQMANQLTAGLTAEMNTGSANLADGTPPSAVPNAVNNGALATSNVTATQLSGPKAQVVVRVPQSTKFASLFMPSLNIAAIAIASVNSNTACDLALATTGTGIATNGNPTINIGNCWLVANSNGSCSGHGANLNPAINIQDHSVTVAGNMSSNGCISFSGNSGCGAGFVCKSDTNSTVPDPFASRASALAADIAAAKASAGKCYGNGAGCTTTITPGRWVGGLTPPTGTNLPSGIYYMDGGNFVVKNATVTGTNVTIVLINSSGGSAGVLEADAGGNLTLGATGTSPTGCTSGCSDFQGMALYQDPNAVSTNANATSFQSNPTVNITGAIYAPKGHVDFQGTPGGNCLEIVSWTMSFSGDSSLDTSGCAGLNVGTPIIYTVALTQ